MLRLYFIPKATCTISYFKPKSTSRSKVIEYCLRQSLEIVGYSGSCGLMQGLASLWKINLSCMRPIDSLVNNNNDIDAWTCCHLIDSVTLWLFFDFV